MNDFNDFSVNCTGNVCVGDEVSFAEMVFSGSYPNSKAVGFRNIEAVVIKDSYGRTKGQHTFTMEITASSGVDPLKIGSKIMRKGRKLYREGTFRKPWSVESDRDVVLDDKYNRAQANRDGLAFDRGLK